MKFYFIKSTGELESAILCISDGYDGIVFDFSTKESKIKNKKLLEIFEDQKVKYFRPPINLKKILILLALMLRGLVISLNSYNKSKIMINVYKLFNVSFIRDALCPRFINDRYINLFCEKKHFGYYPMSSCIELSNNSFDYFMSSISNNIINTQVDLEKYDCILIGKSMKRNGFGLELKKQIYAILGSKFKNVAVIPHPRESQEEINVIRDSGLSVLNELVYSVKCFNKTIIVLNGSSGIIMDLLGIKYYYIPLNNFFIYGDSERISGGKNIIAEIGSLEELNNYCFLRING